jgi:hypothetical protein
MGKLEVADRRALAQKFRVRGDHDVDVGIGLADDALDLVAGATGTVDFVTTTVKPVSDCAISFAAA